MGLATLIQDAAGHRHFFKKAAAIPSPLLYDGVRFPYGPFKFRTQLPRGTSYLILACRDLKNWTVLAKGLAGAEPIEFVDSEAFQLGSRFYRIMAAAIYSQNVIGYVSSTLPPGFSMVANPLKGASALVKNLFPGWPDGTTFSKYDTRMFCLEENEVKNGSWKNSTEKLMPGEGGIFFNPTSDYKSHSFVGEVLQGNLSVPIPSGFSVRSSMLPCQGSLEELHFPITNGDVIHLFDRDRQCYSIHPYENDKWTHGAPVIGLMEAFWVAKAKPGNWVRNLIIGS